jgi:hypothetical protein
MSAKECLMLQVTKGIQIKTATVTTFLSQAFQIKDIQSTALLPIPKDYSVTIFQLLLAR